MTDISTEAVELMADSLDSQTKAAFGTLSRPAKMLRALSARVQELEADNRRLADEVQHYESSDRSDRDEIERLEVECEKERERGRLQGLDEALGAVRKEQRFHPMTQDFKAVIESLKGDTQ